jgi:glutamate-1-semialdehyde 2,1-aminomutase
VGSSVTILDEYTRPPRLHRPLPKSLKPSLSVTRLRFLQPFPIYVDHAKSSRKWDVDGNEYVDYVMGHGALFMGHAHPEITAAVIEQAQKGTHYGANHRLELEWGKLVRQIVPSAEEVRFTSSGTEATLMAIRLARAYTGRDRILKFDQHFHGWHDAVVGTRAPESDNPHAAGVPAGTAGNTISVPQNDITIVEEKLATGDVAAVILEPTGASWGTLPLRNGLLAALRETTRRHDTVLIFDEVVTGFRVAPGGAQQRYGVTPDVTTMAKILAGGLPGGAVAGNADIISMLEIRNDSEWNAERRVQHPGTFNANPLSAAAGAAMLRLVARANTIVTRRAQRAACSAALIEREGVAGSVYGLASYFHIALGQDAPRPSGGIEWPWEDGQLPPRMSQTLTTSLKRAMLNHGIDLMGGSGGFTSGVHTDEDIGRTIKAFEASVREMKAEGLL